MKNLPIGEYLMKSEVIKTALAKSQDQVVA